MTKTILKEKAIRLRKNGKSIGYIASTLDISKSTASKWCRDVSLTTSQISSLIFLRNSAGIKGMLIAAEKRRTKRLEDERKQKEKGAKDIGYLNTRDLYMLGIGLYWGEGYKSGNEELGFTNSDPRMIKFYIKWLEKIYDIPKSKLIFRVSINSIHKQRIKLINEFWINLLDVNQQQFTKPSFIHTPIKKKYTDNSSYYGVLRVKVRNGVSTRRRILGSIEHIKELKYP